MSYATDIYDISMVNKIRSSVPNVRVFEVTYIPAENTQGAKVLIHDKRFNICKKYPFYSCFNDVMDNGIYRLFLMDIEVTGKAENVKGCYLYTNDFKTQLK